MYLARSLQRVLEGLDGGHVARHGFGLQIALRRAKSGSRGFEIAMKAFDYGTEGRGLEL
jgi:hypothetical protein